MDVISTRQWGSERRGEMVRAAMKGARSLSLPWHQFLSADDNHVRAAAALAVTVAGSAGLWVGGGSGSTRVFVWIGVAGAVAVAPSFTIDPAPVA